MCSLHKREAPVTQKIPRAPWDQHPIPSMCIVLLASVPCQAAILECQNAGDIELFQNSFFFCFLHLE